MAMANRGEGLGGGARGGSSTGKSQSKTPKLTGIAKDFDTQLKKGVPMKSSTGKVTIIKPKKKGK